MRKVMSLMLFLCFMAVVGNRAAFAQPTLIDTISFGPNRASPIAANPATNKIYATQEDHPLVNVIDGGTNTVVATVPLLGFNTGIAVNPVTNLVYVAQQFASVIRIIDGATNTVVMDLPVPSIQTVGNPAINPTTNRLYVVRANNNDLAVFDAATNTLLATIPLGVGPSFFPVVNPVTNRIYAAVAATDEVAVIDGASNSVLTTVPVGDNPNGITVNPATNRVYVSNTNGGTVSVIDGATNTVLATIPVGIGPLGLGVNSMTNRIYVPNNGSNDVSVIDGDTNSVVATVPVGLQPSHVAVIEETHRVYVANDGGHSVSVIEDLPTFVPFDSFFDVKVEFKFLGPLPNDDDEFEVKAFFTLGASSDGLDIPVEIVSLELTGGTGAFSTAIPAGNFEFHPAKPGKKGKPGKPAFFTFEGAINGVDLEVKITDLGGGSFEFKAEGTGADLTGMVNPVTVGLIIGNDGGSTTVEAEFE